MFSNLSEKTDKEVRDIGTFTPIPDVIPNPTNPTLATLETRVSVAYLVMRGKSTKKSHFLHKFLVGSFYFTVGIGLFAWGESRTDSNPKEWFGNVLKFIGWSLSEFCKIWMPFYKKQHMLAGNEEIAAAKEVRRYPSLFSEDDKGSITVFENNEQNVQLTLKKDQFELQPIKGDDEKFFPKKERPILFNHPPLKPLLFLYKQTASTFADVKFLTDGANNFREDGVYIGGEILYFSGKQGSLLEQHFNIILNATNLKPTFHAIKSRTDNPDTDPTIRLNDELYLLRLFFKKVKARFKSNAEVDHPDQYPFVNLDLQLVASEGVCRHSTIVLGYYLDQLISLGYLKGTLRFESRSPFTEDETGHAWLTYLIPGHENKPFILDVVNKVANFKENLSDTNKLFFEKYYAYPACDTNLKKLKEWRKAV